MAAFCNTHLSTIDGVSKLKKLNVKILLTAPMLQFSLIENIACFRRHSALKECRILYSMRLGISNHVLVNLLLDGQGAYKRFLFGRRVSLIILRFGVFDLLSRLQGASNVWMHQQTEGVL